MLTHWKLWAKYTYCKIFYDHWPIHIAVSMRDDGYYEVQYICSRCGLRLGND